MKSNTYRFAERELSILSQAAVDPNNRPIIEPFKKEILALCEKFGKSGQSGDSAPYTATAICQALKKLLLQEPIAPVMGVDEEWVNVTEMNGGIVLYQNRRCGGLFKNENNKCYYLNAIAWKTEEGGAWSGSAYIKETGERFLSRQYVKQFPFEPKTFYIDVIEEEVSKDDWTFWIKDPSQLQRVFEYYNKFLGD